MYRSVPDLHSVRVGVVNKNARLRCGFSAKNVLCAFTVKSVGDETFPCTRVPHVNGRGLWLNVRFDDVT